MKAKTSPADSTGLPFLRRLGARLKRLGVALNKGKMPYILSSALLVIGTVLVYFSPRSIPAFLLFATAASLAYFLDMRKSVKLGMAVLIAVVIVPILGARNIFYLEVIFQIAVFSALALGLNIVVGFSACSTSATWPSTR